MAFQVIEPNGGIRRDPEARAAILAEARREPAIHAIVESIDDGPAGFGFFGVLLRGRLRDDGRDVVVKVNAQADERVWLPAIGRIEPDAVPAVFGDGDTVGDLDVGWLCMELLPHVPPEDKGPEWYQPLLEAVARWHAATRRLDLVPEAVIDGAWLGFWVDCALDIEPTPALRELRNRFDDDWAWVAEHFETAGCHGDVHFFNAGSRVAGAPPPLVLFDPIPRAAPWPFDAAYCHTLTNFHAIRGDGPSLVERFAELRRAEGLPTPGAADLDRVSRLLCAWLAAMWRTIFVDIQPDRAHTIAGYVDAALDA